MTVEARAPQAVRQAALLVVDADENHCGALQRAFERRSYAVRAARSARQALCLLNGWRPSYAIIELRLPGESGLTLIPQLQAACPGVRIVMVTGYASIATAVEAIKLGAVQYLVKPAHPEQIERAFARVRGDESVAPGPLPSLSRLEWEHIQRALADCGGNISAAARALDVHRRTLQRKLGKLPARR